MNRKRHQSSFDSFNTPLNPELYCHIERLHNLLEQYDRQNLFLNKQVLDILKIKQSAGTKYTSSKFNTKITDYKTKRYTQIDDLLQNDRPVNLILDQIRRQRLQKQKRQGVLQRQKQKQKLRQRQRERSRQILRQNSSERRANSVRKFQYYDQSQNQKLGSSNNRKNDYYSSSIKKFSYVSQQEEKYKKPAGSAKIPSKTASSFYTKPFTLLDQKSQHLTSTSQNKFTFRDRNPQPQPQEKPQPQPQPAKKQQIASSNAGKNISKSKYVLQKINQSQQQDKQRSKIRQSQIKRIKTQLISSSNIVPVIKRQVYFRSPDRSNASNQQRNDSPIGKNYQNASRISIKSDQSRNSRSKGKSGIEVTTKKQSPQKKEESKQFNSPLKLKTVQFNKQQNSEQKNQNQISKISESIIKYQNYQGQVQQKPQVQVFQPQPQPVPQLQINLNPQPQLINAPQILPQIQVKQPQNQTRSQIKPETLNQPKQPQFQQAVTNLNFNTSSLDIIIPTVTSTAVRQPSQQLSNAPLNVPQQPVFQTIRTRYLTSIGINTDTQQQQPIQISQPQMTRNKSFSHHRINPSQKITVSKTINQQYQPKNQRPKSMDRKKKFINIVSNDLLLNKLSIKDNQKSRN